MGSLLNLAKYVTTTQTFVQGVVSDVVDATFLQSLAMVTEVTVSTPANQTFPASAVNTSTDTITLAAHGYALGLTVQFSNPGTLPTGISALTNYWIVPVDANSFKIATSLSNANANITVDITAQGSGTNTVNVTALAGATAVLQRSLKNSTNDADWSNDGSSVNITATGNTYFEATASAYPSANYYRIKYTITAGQLTADVRVLGKGLA